MRRLLSIIALTLVMTTVKAQKMTMTEVIETARQQSVAALEARQAFISTYCHGAHIKPADCRHCISTVI